MANKSLTDLAARTATADSDLIHVNSGGTDYKQTKARFCNDIVQYIDFANTSSLTGQCDTLGSSVKSPAYFAGKINSYGHQSACGTPENNSYHVLLSIYSGNYHELTITDVDTGAIWRKLKINGTWQSSWVMSPTRNEITSLNNSLTKCFNISDLIGLNSSNPAIIPLGSVYGAGILLFRLAQGVGPLILKFTVNNGSLSVTYMDGTAFSNPALTFSFASQALKIQSTYSGTSTLVYIVTNG